MEGLMKLLNTRGVGEQLIDEIKINKNKNIEINKKNLINELQDIIDSSLEDIFCNEIPILYNVIDVEDWEGGVYGDFEWKQVETIEEHNFMGHISEDYPYFHKIMLMWCTNEFY